MFVRLEKIDPAKRQRRFYEMTVGRDLFGEWCLVREWGRIGAAGGRRRVDRPGSRDAAEAALGLLSGRKRRRGYRLSRAAPGGSENNT
ncbi:WGR domain-containing protein [Celeribacter indicus]|uniref:WGR domain-containing protein n=1 Tax=Celeribacter indicus TaxID=1208324 RepID=A0A0B5E1J8_9RHOB|nr:WGR domain-containing protein [Celeribacter indicus]AJE49129.1 hypothetical protein P73_4414 [Celeribacter indicus]SDX17161.1 WGR domain-containing protein, predicted DNA-binding domain in MolR [Celeribacter indicus]